MESESTRLENLLKEKELAKARLRLVLKNDPENFELIEAMHNVLESYHIQIMHIINKEQPRI